ncbi:MAG TPA: hypothetical protein VGB04_01500 [Allosphingosinicella sp.]|jgi:hypothetical protein
MSIKFMLFGVAAAGVGGAALTGGGLGGHDAERLVAKPPAEVYAAISAMAPEGIRQAPLSSDLPAMKLEVRKEQGEAVHYILTMDGKQIGRLDLAVAGQKDGKSSTLAADIDVDQRALAKLMDPETGDQFVPAPDMMINLTMNEVLGELAADIEAGRALPTMGPLSMSAWSNRLPTLGEAKAVREEMQEAASRPTAPVPTASAKPMVDPNEAAKAYMRGGR